MNNLLLLFFIYFFQPVPPTSYLPLHTQDAILFSYTWKHAEKKNSASPLECLLKIENTRTENIVLDYTLNFYLDGKLAESYNKSGRCIKKGKKAIGRINGDYFQSAVLTNEDILSESFSLEITDVKFQVIDKCP